MIDAKQIPDEAVEAAAIILMGRLMVSQQDAHHVWSGMYEPEKDQFRREARASIAAALAAWPGMHKWDTGQVWHQASIILPLPQESNNAEG